MADNYEIEVTLEETFGTGIRSVEQTGSSSASGGLNEITVTLTNDQQNKFYIMNGLKGEDGKDGRDGSSPIAVTAAEQMTDHSQIYLYGGNEEGYVARHLYYWNGSEWADYGLYGMPDTYLSAASIENETELDQHGNTVSTSTTLGITGRILSNPAYYEFVQKLYSVSGENEDGALTQKATSEAIEAAQFLPILNHPIAPVGDNYLSASLVPNVLNVLNGVGYTFTEVNLTLSGAKENTLTRWFVRFTTGGNAVTDFDFPDTVTVPSEFSLKTQTTYDIVIENGVAHIWEDGNAVGNVLDAEATADAVADWLDDHPEATTTVADGSITTAKLASGVIDNTLLVSGAAADSAKVGQELSDLKSQITNGVPNEVKRAMDTLFQNMAFDNTDSEYLDEIALIHSWATAVTLTSITAVFDQDGLTVYPTTPLSSLKSHLTVTAHYDDSSSVEVSDYTLNGTLEVGTSTITVSYGGKSTSFAVTVSTPRVPSEYTEVEYLVSNQTDSVTGAYIDSGVKFSSPTTAKYRITVEPIAVASTWTDGQHFIGTRQTNTGSTNNNGYTVGVNNTSGFYSFSGTPAASFMPSNIYEKHDIESTWTASSLKIKVDDNEEVTSSLTTRGCSGYNISVFGIISLKSQFPGATYLFNGKVYFAEIEQNGTVLATLIPCTRNSDNAVGMYDLVNERFITPSVAGQGSISAITAGNPV